MLITPLAQLQLSHRANLLEATPDGTRIVVASYQGEILVLDENLITLFEYDIGYTIDNLTISPNGQNLACTNKNGQILVIRIDGNVLLDETTSNCQEMYCNECLFSNDGTQLWHVVELENNQVQIQYRETKQWQVLKRAVLLNGNSYNYFSLTYHPENKVLAVWEAAGQDGCWMYWVWDDDVEIRVLEIPELENKISPEFHPAGGEFLVVDDLGRLCRYRFPDCHLMETAALKLEEEDDFAYYMCYLSDERAIVKSENSRLFIVDLDSMRVIDEVILKGHEPRSLNEIFPKFANDRSMCGNISYFKRAGQDKIVSLHRRYEELQDTLLLWGGNLLFGKCSQPSSMTPYTKQLIKLIKR
jgi:WD40 repeat protein